MIGYRPFVYAPATVSDALPESDSYIIDEDIDLVESVEVSTDEQQLMQTIVNQLIVTDLLIALAIGCICAGIFSRYIRG